MKTIGNPILVSLVAAGVGFARADDVWRAQTVTLKSGWNAFSLEVSSDRSADVNGDGVPNAFSVADPTAALQSRLSTGQAELDCRTVCVKKEGASRFWKLEVE